jgi:hypothetical protein
LSVHFGEQVLDWGIANIPKAVLRFYRYLQSDGERLSDAEMMSLLLILSLGADRDFELRIGNLPAASSPETIQRKYLTKWRRMGLVQTTRQYYSSQEMSAIFGDNAPLTPRLKTVVFDLSGLLYNIFLIANEWSRQYHQAIVAWEASGKQGPRPVFEFPRDFAHEVVLSPEQARAIRRGAYQFVPRKWLERARQMGGDAPAPSVSVRDDAPARLVSVREDAPARLVSVREDAPARSVSVREDAPARSVSVRARTGTISAGHLESSASVVSYVSNVIPANAGAQSARFVSRDHGDKSLSSSASSVTDSPGRRPAGSDVKGVNRPAERSAQGEEASDRSTGRSTPAGSANNTPPEGETTELQHRDIEAVSVPEKVRYWEAAIARAKRNPTGCICRAVEDLLGIPPNYGHVGKLVKRHGRMTVWRQVKAVLLNPPAGDLWAYVARALEKNGESSPKSRSAPSRRSVVMYSGPAAAARPTDEWWAKFAPEAAEICRRDLARQAGARGAEHK